MIEKFTVEVNVGDIVEIGRMHLANQEIKSIEIDKWGHPVMAGSYTHLTLPTIVEV